MSGSPRLRGSDSYKTGSWLSIFSFPEKDSSSQKIKDRWKGTSFSIFGNLYV